MQTKQRYTISKPKQRHTSGTIRVVYSAYVFLQISLCLQQVIEQTKQRYAHAQTGSSDDILSRKGKMTYANGDVYDGEWKDDLPRKGKMTLANGDVYDGEWETKKGKMTYVNGNVYDGEWEDDLPKKGKMTYANGDVYNGEWEDGLEMTYADGVVYDGEKVHSDLCRWRCVQWRMEKMARNM